MPQAKDNGDVVPARDIAVNVLLVSGDIQAIDTLCRFMEQMSMHVDVCSLDSAARKLCHAKFEAVVVDFKYGARAVELIKKTREMTSHKAVVVLAILTDSSEMPSAFRAGANFTLSRPLVLALLMRTLRASYPIMVREMRRYFRYPLQIPIRVSSHSRREFLANSVNISEGGMAIVSSVPLHIAERVDLNLTLQGTERVTRITGEVCWTNQKGRMGLVFVDVPAAVLARLQSWLGDCIEERMLC